MDVFHNVLQPLLRIHVEFPASSEEALENRDVFGGIVWAGKQIVLTLIKPGGEWSFLPGCCLSLVFYGKTDRKADSSILAKVQDKSNTLPGINV